MLTGENGESVCHTLLHCSLFIFDSGFKYDGGIGGSLIEVDYDRSWHYVLKRMLYDNAYNIVLCLVMINIVFGIMLDTFSELRDTEVKRQEDQNTKCTICHIDSSTFDRRSEGGFSRHTEQDHNMWDYVYFIVWLQKKNPTERTGMESYMSQMIFEEDPGFFPVGKSLALIEWEDETRASRHDDSVAPEIDTGVLNLMVHDLSEQVQSLREELRASQRNAASVG